MSLMFHGRSERAPTNKRGTLEASRKHRGVCRTWEWSVAKIKRSCTGFWQASRADEVADVYRVGVAHGRIFAHLLLPRQEKLFKNSRAHGGAIPGFIYPRLRS